VMTSPSLHPHSFIKILSLVALSYNSKFLIHVG
jgi:hypothetical protein